MPLTVQCGYVILHDGTIATTAFRSEHVEVILSAVRLAVPLVESLFAKLFATLSAEEVLRVPSFFQSGYAFVQNGTVTVGTTGREKIMVIRFAVRMTLSLEEVSCA